MKRKFLLLITILLAILCFTSCAESSGADYDIDYSNGYSDTVSENEIIYTDDTRKIYYIANLTIKSNDIGQDAKNLNTLVDTYNGYIESINTSKDDDGTYTKAVYKYRIPSDKLQDFLSNVDDGYVVVNKTLTSTDITSSYNKTEAAIETLTASRAAYEEMLKNATDVNTLISIKSKIDEIDQELLTYSKELASYDNLLEYSTVNVTLTKKYTYQEPTFMDEYVSYLGGFVTTIFKIIMYMLPFAALGGIILLIIFLSMKASKRSKEKKQKTKEENIPKAESKKLE